MTAAKIKFLLGYNMKINILWRIKISWGTFFVVEEHYLRLLRMMEF